jgi:hypothetical protein
MLVVIIMLLLLCRTWPHLFVPRQLLLLPFSASDVTNKLLDIALGPQAPPVAQCTTSPCVLRLGKRGREVTTRLLVFSSVDQLGVLCSGRDDAGRRSLSHHGYV